MATLAKGPVPAVVAPGPTCGTCRWLVAGKAGGVSRCHLNPPSPKMPWGEESVRPVVAASDPACAGWKQKTTA
jgi:hypothetical protein